jgi:hypothetical protein
MWHHQRAGQTNIAILNEEILLYQCAVAVRSRRTAKGEITMPVPLRPVPTHLAWSYASVEDRVGRISHQLEMDVVFRQVELRGRNAESPKGR